MAELSDGLLGCYRCAYVWRSTGRHPPRICPRCKSRSWDTPKLRPISRGTGLGIREILLPRREDVWQAARRWGFDHVRVFGSVRRSEGTAKSDVDLLVDRQPGTSLLERAALVDDLERMLGRRVDVVPEEALHWLVRPQVLFEARAL